MCNNKYRPHGNVIIIGATGMVGSCLVNRLISIDVKCILISRKKPKIKSKLVVWKYWDVGDWKSTFELDRLFDNASVIVHLASWFDNESSNSFEKHFFDVNVRSCANIGNWANIKSVPMVFVSSSSVYSNPRMKKITEESSVGDISVGKYYAASKVMSEVVIRQLAKDGLHACILRPSSLYGIGLPSDKMIMRFLNTMLNGEKIKLIPPVHNRVNLLNTEDMVSAIINCINKNIYGVYNIPGPKNYSILEVAEACAIASNGSFEIGLDVESDYKDSSILFDLDGSAAYHDFGYSPLILLEDGLKEIVDYLKRE